MALLTYAEATRIVLGCLSITELSKLTDPSSREEYEWHLDYLGKKHLDLVLIVSQTEATICIDLREEYDRLLVLVERKSPALLLENVDTLRTTLLNLKEDFKDQLDYLLDNLN